MYKSVFLTLLLLSFCTAADAQQKPLGSMAIVFGRVYSAETNAPLRNADVFLIPAEQIGKSLQNSGEGYQIVSSVPAEKTLLDGSFNISGVTPGVYYVIAVKNGYISALDQLRLHPPEDLADQEKRSTLLKMLPAAMVDNNQPVAVNIPLAHGGSISGTLAYDDGSPADGIRLSVLYRIMDEWKAFPADGETFNPTSISDDTGHYRLSGIPPGEYIVRADLQVATRITRSWRGNGLSQSSPGFLDLFTYSGNKMRASEAIGFKLGEGESRSGEDIEIGISRLRSISGHLTAVNDGHILNAGSVILLHADDRSQIGSAYLTPDETAFHFDLVPEGDYILRVEWAEDANYYKDTRNHGSFPIKHTIKIYNPTEQPIKVTGDEANLLIVVPSEKFR